MSPRGTGWAFIICLGFGTGGCSTAKTFEKLETTIDQDSYVLAFSLDTSALEEGDWPFELAMLDTGIGSVRWVTGSNSRIGMFVLKVPEASLSLGDLLFTKREGGNLRLYKSTEEGPTVQLEKGSVIYLGSLVVDEIHRDKEMSTPVALDVRIVDSWEKDGLAWKSTFAVFQAHDPIRQIAARWGNSEEIELYLVESAGVWRYQSEYNYAAHGGNPRGGNVSLKKAPRY